MGSDHHLIIGRMKLKLRRFYTATAKSGHRYNLSLLTKRSKTKFQVEIFNRFQLFASLIEEDRTVEQVWQHTKTGGKETCEGILGKRTRQHKEWISADTIQKIEERKRRKPTVNGSRTRAAKAESQRLYSEANKVVKRSVKQEKKNFVEDLVQQAE